MFSLFLALFLAVGSVSVTSAIQQPAQVQKFAVPTFKEVVQKVRENLKSMLQQFNDFIKKGGIPQNEMNMLKADTETLVEQLSILNDIEARGQNAILTNKKAIALSIVMMALSLSTALTNNEELQTAIVETFQPIIDKIVLENKDGNASENKRLILEASLVPALKQELMHSQHLVDLLQRARTLYVKFKEDTTGIDQAIAELQSFNKKA